MKIHAQDLVFHQFVEILETIVKERIDNVEDEFPYDGTSPVWLGKVAKVREEAVEDIHHAALRLIDYIKHDFRKEPKMKSPNTEKHRIVGFGLKNSKN
jgi:hypothetical protein